MIPGEVCVITAAASVVWFIAGLMIYAGLTWEITYPDGRDPLFGARAFWPMFLLGPIGLSLGGICYTIRVVKYLSARCSGR